jgi:hypothetical protein
MKEKEYILCSAININDIIISGRRHNDCYDTLSKIEISCESKKIHEPNRKEQGFLTSTGRFVYRKEAWNIAKENDQIKYGRDTAENGDDSELVSENLFM